MDEFFATSIRLASPMILAAMAGILCERAGIATICLEGGLLITAWSSAVLNLLTKNPWFATALSAPLGMLTLVIH